MSKIDHEFTDEIVCPHCGYKFEESWEWEDEGEATCYGCEQDFTFERHTTVEYTTEKKAQDNE